MVAAKTRDSPVAILTALNTSFDRQYELCPHPTLLVIYCTVPFLKLSSELILENGLGFCTFCRLYNSCTMSVE